MTRLTPRAEPVPCAPGGDLHLRTVAGEAAERFLIQAGIRSAEESRILARDRWLKADAFEPWELWLHAIREFWLTAREKAVAGGTDEGAFGGLAAPLGYRIGKSIAIGGPVWSLMVTRQEPLRRIIKRRLPEAIGPTEEVAGVIQNGEIAHAFRAGAYYCGVLAARRARELGKVATAEPAGVESDRLAKENRSDASHELTGGRSQRTGFRPPAPPPTASGANGPEVSTGKNEAAVPIQWLVAWRQQQQDIAVQNAWDRMGRKPGWEKAQLQLIQADEDRGQSISSGSASPWQVGVRYYKALAEAWLGLVTDTQSTQDFYTLLPVIVEGVYRQCLEGATPESFRPSSDGGREFQTDLATLDRDFRRRAAQRAITGGKTPTSTLDGGSASGADTATSAEAISGRAARRRAVVDPILKRKRWKIGRLVTDSGVGKATVYGYMDGTRAWISKENREAICQSLDLELGKLPE